MVTNKLLKQIIKPITIVYLDDLKIQNPNETFGTYQIRMSTESHQNIAFVRKAILTKLSISQAKDSQTMWDLVKSSLDNSILQLARDYGKTVPFVISFGLGIIVQTLLSISSVIANFITAGLLIFLKKIKVITTIPVSYTIEKEVYPS